MPRLLWRSGDIFILRFGSAKNRAKANSSVSGVTPDESIRQFLSQGIRDRYGYCPYFYSPESDTVRQALTETGTANGTILFVRASFSRRDPSSLQRAGRRKAS